MKPTEQIKYIVDQIVIAYCNYKKFRDEKFGNDFEDFTSRLMDATGLDREEALEYAVNFLAAQNKHEGVA